MNSTDQGLKPEESSPSFSPPLDTLIGKWFGRSPRLLLSSDGIHYLPKKIWALFRHQTSHEIIYLLFLNFQTSLLCDDEQVASVPRIWSSLMDIFFG